MSDGRTLPRLVPALLVCVLTGSAFAGERWSEQRANRWYARQPWLVGCNYTPRTAVNQLEFWQAETFDPATIDQELGWAHDLGFNCLRVYLHSIPWDQEADGFCARIDQFLGIADKHGMRVMFVLLDDCWDPAPQPGKQPEPVPHLHNSGWVQCPGAAILGKPERHDELKPYVVGIIRRFREDRRVLAWDLYNEPGNASNRHRTPDPPNKAELSLMLLRKAFDWARLAEPTQPLTVGLWSGRWDDPNSLSPINRVSLELSDITTFHSYSGLKEFRSRAEAAMQYKRPVICTEYLNRGSGCTFQAILPYLKENNIGAINWGLVAGKIQTQYPWSSWTKKFTAEPQLWFHDVLRPNGTPFSAEEVELIRKLTGRGKSSGDYGPFQKKCDTNPKRHF